MLWIWIISWYGLAGVVTFAAFVVDKRAAVSGRWRTRERTLHALELFGGWVGAWVAMVLVRHKIRKPGYIVVTGLISLIHIGGWWWWRSRFGLDFQ